MLIHDYRPRKFEDMIAQKGIIGEFKNRSKNMNYSEAMILEGESGSGKTTAALIIASILNCSNPIILANGEHQPCGECASCKDIQNEKFYRDVTFFDASSMKKDNVISIEQIVSTSPMYDKNKIIIIDEAQELSKASKGATLKLLEKKRKNVYFILCTMDANSIHRSVRDRCQEYKFKKVDSVTISEYLFKILEKEDPNEKIPEVFIKEGLTTIADNSDGSIRNALQHLERCMIGKFYTNEEIMKEFGFISDESMFSIIFKLLKKDSTVLNELKKIDMKEFFYKSRKILTDGMIYKMTQVSQELWKEKNAKIIAKYNTVFDLLNVYLKVSVMPYFNDSVYLYELIDYLNRSTTNSKRTILKESNMKEVSRIRKIR